MIRSIPAGLEKLTGHRNRAHHNLRVRPTSEGEAGTTDAKKAGSTLAKYLQSYPGADADLGQAADPMGLAVDFLNIRPFSRSNQFQGEQSIVAHVSEPLNRPLETPAALLRLNLNIL
jgi:hypothetical protein